MTLDQALFNYLSTFAGLTALIGTRVYPRVLPQNPTYPAVTYQRVSSTRMRTMGAPLLGAEPRIQFTIWAETHLAARAIATQLRAALEGYTGTMGGAGGVDVLGAQEQNDLDDYEPLTKLHQAILDFTIWHHGD